MASWLSSMTIIATHSLGIALLQTLWQGAILYFLLRIVLVILKNAAASARYALSYTTLGAMCIWFICDWISQAQAYPAAFDMIQASGGIVQAHINAASYNTQSGLNTLLNNIEYYLPYFWYIYIPGLTLMAARLMLNMFSIYTYRTKGITHHYQVQATTDQLLFQMNITRKVKVYLSDRIKVPAMIGALRPYILLPVTILTQLDDAQLQAILMHELAHIKRHDYLLNLLQVFVETILFFNPFIWLVNSIIRREREHCCDDIVVAYTQQPYHYVTALAQLEQYRIAPVALAATGNKYHLFTRIKRIIEMKKNPTTQRYIPGVVLVCMALLIPIFWFTPGFAQKVKNDKETSDKKTKKEMIIVDSSGTVKQYDITDDNKDELMNEAKPGKHEIVTIRNKNIVINTDSISACIKAAMDAIGNSENMEYVKLALADAQKQIEKSGREMKNIEIHMDDKEMKEAEKEINSIDWEGIGTDIANAMKDIHIEISDNNNGTKMVQKKMKIVPEEEHYAKGPYERMLDKMQADGLIEKNDGFEIEKDGNHLYINGDKQPRSVYDKYSHYLSANQVTIKGKKNRLNINVRD